MKTITEIQEPGLYDDREWEKLEKMGLEFDSTYCASCRRPIGAFLVTNEDTGHDREAWRTPWLVDTATSSQFMCEDCAYEDES